MPAQAGKITLTVQIDGDQPQTLNLPIQLLPSLIEAITIEADNEETNDTQQGENHDK